MFDYLVHLNIVECAYYIDNLLDLLVKTRYTYVDVVCFVSLSFHMILQLGNCKT